MARSFGKISEVILTEPVNTCGADLTLGECLKIMRTSTTGCIVIMEPGGGKVAGIFTERDYIRKIAGNSINLGVKTVREYMTPDPVSLKGGDDVISALIKMRMGKFRHIVVVDDNKNLKALLSLREISEHIIDNYL